MFQCLKHFYIIESKIDSASEIKINSEKFLITIIYFYRMEDIQTYHQVLKDSEFNADPLGTITAQLIEKLKSGRL